MRAKFKVEHAYNGGQNITLTPVGSIPAVMKNEQKLVNGKIIDVAVVDVPRVPPPGDNEVFFDSSHAEPGGEIRLLLVAPGNAKEFREGRVATVTFTFEDD